MFCAENSQRNGEAQGSQGYHLVDTVSLSDIVFRGQQTDHKQREASGGHRDRSACEFGEYGKNSWLHGSPGGQTALHSMTKFGEEPNRRHSPMKPARSVADSESSNRRPCL